MSTKEQLLELFENNKGTYLSGEEIAEKLSVSRAAVWKAVKGLRNEGYNIDAITNKGYNLSVKTDILSVQGIKKYLDLICSDLSIEVLPSLNSTNKRAREKAILGAPEGYVVIANAQTNGRGRNGREFFSPADTGIYMSLVLRPPRCSPQQATKLTTMAAVAVCEAIEMVSNEKAQIKWVNDVYVKGKKVCGILTEASLGLEDNFLEYAIIGIGVNVSPPMKGFPKELQSIANAVFEEAQNDGKNRIAAEILNRFMSYYTVLPKINYIEQYRNRSFVIGKEIVVLSPDDPKKAVALDIDDDFHLIVKYEDNKTETLSSGEISVRLQ